MCLFIAYRANVRVQVLEARKYETKYPFLNDNFIKTIQAGTGCSLVQRMVA